MSLNGMNLDSEIRLEQSDLNSSPKCRAKLNLKTIEDYGVAMKSHAVFPPIILFRDTDGTLRLADGWHRLEGSKRAGLEMIRAEIRAGSWLDAVRYAVGANAAHGMRRSNADKKVAVELALRELQELSDHGIADLTGTSQPFVSRLRQVITVITCAATEQSGDSEACGSEMSVGRDGKRYPRRQSKAAAAEAESTSEPEGKASQQEGESTTKHVKGNLVVVVWDDNGAVEPAKFYSRATYPNIVFCHLWPPGCCRFRRKGWCSYGVLLAVQTDEGDTIKSGGVPFCRSSVRFVSVSARGSVRDPVVMPSQLIENGLGGVLKAVQEMWPVARKIVAANLPEAPQGWEIVTSRSARSPEQAGDKIKPQVLPGHEEFPNQDPEEILPTELPPPSLPGHPTLAPTPTKPAGRGKQKRSENKLAEALESLASNLRGDMAWLERACAGYPTFLAHARKQQANLLAEAAAKAQALQEALASRDDIPCVQIKLSRFPASGGNPAGKVGRYGTICTQLAQAIRPFDGTVADELTSLAKDLVAVR